jgi:hypothetical protein
VGAAPSARRRPRCFAIFGHGAAAAAVRLPRKVWRAAGDVSPTWCSALSSDTEQPFGDVPAACFTTQVAASAFPGHRASMG